jgi:hypothetical protein
MVVCATSAAIDFAIVLLQDYNDWKISLFSLDTRYWQVGVRLALFSEKKKELLRY